jgi:hypothetical protein
VKLNHNAPTAHPRSTITSYCLRTTGVLHFVYHLFVLRRERVLAYPFCGVLAGIDVPQNMFCAICLYHRLDTNFIRPEIHTKLNKKLYNNVTLWLWMAGLADTHLQNF